MLLSIDQWKEEVSNFKNRVERSSLYIRYLQHLQAFYFNTMFNPFHAGGLFLYPLLFNAAKLSFQYCLVG